MNKILYNKLVKKLCISLLALVITTLAGPCFECGQMEMTIPKVKAMSMRADDIHDCGARKEKASHTEKRNCPDARAPHHTIILESTITTLNAGDFNGFKNLHFSQSAAGLNFHYFNSAIKQSGTRSPHDFSPLKKIPPNLPGIIVKKE